MKKETSTNSLNEKHLQAACATAYTLSVIGARWKTSILHILLHGKLRYSDLKGYLTGISERMLVQQLKELEKDGLISRTTYAEVPVRVEYELTEDGFSLRQILELTSDWGRQRRMKYKPEEQVKDMCMYTGAAKAGV